MAFRLIGQNAVVTYQLGTIQNGTAPTYATAVALPGVTSIKPGGSVKMADMSVLADSIDVMQATRVGRKVVVERKVGNTGLLFEGLEGFHIKIIIKVVSTISSGTIYEGIISDVSNDIPDGAQTETITITCGANGTSLTP